MKRTFFCLIGFILICISISVSGQEKEIFKSYADTVNIEFSARFLLEFRDSVLADFSFVGVDSPVNNESTLLAKLDSAGYDLNLEIAETICKIRDYFLDKKLSDTTIFRKGLDSIYHYITYTVINTSRRNNADAIEGLYAFISNLQEETWDKFNTEIVEKLNGIESSPDNGGGETKDAPKKETTFNLKGFIINLAILAGFLSFLIWIVYIVVKFRNTDRDWIPLSVKDYIEKQLNVQSSEIKEQDKKFTNLSEMDSVIRKLEKDIHLIHKDIAALQYYQSGSPGVDEKASEIELTVEPPKKIEIYYMPFPDLGGFFWDDKKSGTQQRDTPYILEIDPSNPNKGEFTLIDNRPDLIRNAITSANTFLKPVCTIEGPVSGDKITVISKGQLERRNDKWMIADSKKLVIKIHN